MLFHIGLVIYSHINKNTKKKIDFFSRSWPLLILPGVSLSRALLAARRFVEVAKEEVDSCTEVLRRVRGPAEKEILDPEPFIGGIAGLDPVSSVVFKGGAVMLPPLLAPLLKEALYSGDWGFSVLALPWVTWSRQSSITAAI